MTDAKYSEGSCAEPIQQFLEGNAREAVRGEVGQGTELVGGNLEDVDADIQRFHNTFANTFAYYA